MSTAPSKNVSSETPSAAKTAGLGVSAYDRTAALLVALLVMVGVFVSMLVVIWITSRVFTTQQAVPVEFIEELSSRGDAALGSARDLEEPGLEEVEDLNEPQLEQTLEAITNVISAQQATLDTLEGEARSSTKGRGLGDSRVAGPGGEGNTIPRWERWQIEFNATTLAEYADKLDFFGVELAALGGGSKQIDYAFNLTKKKPDTRSSSEDDKRIYFTWSHGSLRAGDRDLLARAGITTQDRLLVQFYPAKVENMLALLENKELGGSPLDSVKKTVFGVVGKPGSYEFVVLQMQRKL